jgi:hypothetical protein
MKIGRLYTKVLYSALAFFSILTIVSYLGAWSYDEGHRATADIIENDVFAVMRFPTHTLLWNFISKDAVIAIAYPVGLLVNIVFYAFLYERIFYLFMKMKRVRTN